MNSCQKEISFENSGSFSAGSLQSDGAGACLPKTVAGSYVEGVALKADSNYIEVQVNVAQAGSYTINTDTVNGIYFRVTGVFTTAGISTVRVRGNGTPLVSGIHNFIVSYDSTECTIVLTTLPAGTPAPVLSDYFPRTANSNWSYEFDDDPNDSLYVRTTSATITISGNVYNIFEWTDSADSFDEYGKFRKDEGNYYSYADMGEYFGFDNSIPMEYIFLKDDVPVNTSWQTATINGATTSGTVPIRIVFTIVEKDVTVNIGGTPYDSTIVLTEKYEVFTGASWIDVTDIIGYYKIYYAKNIGMIKQDFYYEDGNPDPPLYYKGYIRRYQVF